jgi:hypothetical protein
MTDDVLGRLVAQTALVSGIRREASGLQSDDVLGMVDVAKLRPQAEAAHELSRRLTEQAEALDDALRYAARVRNRHTATLQTDATIAVELNRILADIAAVHDHVAYASRRDESSRGSELDVLRLLQEANAQMLGSVQGGVQLTNS